MNNKNQTSNELSTAQRNFEIAVNLVKSLPQKGPFQPSYSEAGKIYSYFKQSKLGPCTQPRPGFWDVVNRAKWDAWSALGDMPQEIAMKHYVEEIKNVYSRIREIEEFANKEHDYADALIPFCEIIGLKLSPKLQEIAYNRKKIEVKLDKSKDNQNIENENTSQTSDIEFDNKDLPKISETDKDESQFKENKNDNSVYTTEGHEHSIMFENTAPTNPLQGQVDIDQVNVEDNERSSLVHEDAVSSGSEDEIYCDSMDPDQVACLSKTAHSSINKDTEKPSSITFEEKAVGTPVKHKFQQDHVESTPYDKLSVKNSNDFELLPDTSEIKQEIRKIRKCENNRSPNSSSTSSSSSKGFEFVNGHPKYHCKKNKKNDTERSTCSSKQTRQSHGGNNKKDNLGVKSSQHHSSYESDSDTCGCNTLQSNDAVGLKIVQTLERLEENLTQITDRLDSINSNLTRPPKSFWKYYIPSPTILFSTLWPILINLIFYYFWRKKTNRRLRKC